MIWLEIESWPQPWQRVEGLPLYSAASRPIRFVLGVGAGRLTVVTIGRSLLVQDRVGDEAGGQRQAVAMGDAPHGGRALRDVQLDELAHLPVEVQLDDVDRLVVGDELAQGLFE